MTSLKPPPAAITPIRGRTSPRARPRQLALVLSLFSLVACESTGPGTSGGTVDGFVPLFNGRDLAGWRIESDGEFLVRDGVLVVDRGTGWLRSERQFADFVLRLEFRFLEKEANSGIFIRTRATSKDDENGWPDYGYQVQCMDTVTGQRPIATMIPYGAPPFEPESDLDAIEAAYRPTGEWNTYVIRCVGTDLEVRFNGVLVTTAKSIKNPKGHVGIQAEHGLVEFRRIEIKEL